MRSGRVDYSPTHYRNERSFPGYSDGDTLLPQFLNSTLQQQQQPTKTTTKRTYTTLPRKNNPFFTQPYNPYPLNTPTRRPPPPTTPNPTNIRKHRITLKNPSVPFIHRGWISIPSQEDGDDGEWQDSTEEYDGEGGDGKGYEDAGCEEKAACCGDAWVVVSNVDECGVYSEVENVGYVRELEVCFGCVCGGVFEWMKYRRQWIKSLEN